MDVLQCRCNSVASCSNFLQSGADFYKWISYFLADCNHGTHVVSCLFVNVLLVKFWACSHTLRSIWGTQAGSHLPLKMDICFKIRLATWQKIALTHSYWFDERLVLLMLTLIDATHGFSIRYISKWIVFVSYYNIRLKCAQFQMRINTTQSWCNKTTLHDTFEALWPLGTVAAASDWVSSVSLVTSSSRRSFSMAWNNKL